MEYSPYFLKSSRDLNALSGREVEGVLLRDEGGYACLQSWPALGDPSLKVLLECLKRRELTHSLLQRSMHCLALDREARSQGISLYEGLEAPKSHATLTDYRDLERWLESGFQVIKVKVGKDLKSDKEFLESEMKNNQNLRWRLDANGALSQEDACSLLQGLEGCIDWFEDPWSLPEVSRWSAHIEGVQIAVDRSVELHSAPQRHVGVIKSAVNDSERVLKAGYRECLMTSYMDHPLGQCFAAYEASRFSQSFPVGSMHGLQTHALFALNDFSERFGDLRSEFTFPGGTGLGFDDLLPTLTWRSL